MKSIDKSSLPNYLVSHFDINRDIYCKEYINIG